MLIRTIEDVPAIPYGEGALKRVVFAQKEGAPNFAMRIFDLPPGCGSSGHAHDFEHQVLVLQGQGVLTGPTGETPFAVGSALFIPPNERHQLRNTGDETLRFVCVVPLSGEDSCGMP